MTESNVFNRLAKIVDSVLYSYGGDIFYDYIDYLMYLCSCHSIPLTMKIEDDKHLSVLNNMVKALAYAQPYEDCFGALYEHCASKTKKSSMGQFFTPQHVSDMTALIVMGTPQKVRRHFLRAQRCCKRRLKKRYPWAIPIAIGIDFSKYRPIFSTEPCVGSGRMVLAGTRVHRESKQKRSLVWYCMDLDPLCCKMTALNCFLNSIPAYIFYGDSLRLEFYHCYVVKTVLHEGHHVPVLYKASDEEFKALCEQLAPTITDTNEKIVIKEEPIKPPTLFDDDYQEVRVEHYKQQQQKQVKSAKKGGDDTQLSLF